MRRLLVLAAFLFALRAHAAPTFGAEARAFLALEVGLNFTGTTFSESGWYPPDTMGAVGRDHLVELLNGRYAVYRKSDGAELDATSLDGFWSRAGVQAFGTFDPRLLYDAATDRFFAVSLDSGFSNRILVAVSRAGDPRDGWTGFAFDSDSTDQTRADFPTVGIDDQGLYVDTLQMIVGTETIVADDVLVVPKHGLLAASPTIASATLFERAPLAVAGFDSQPVVDLDGGALPHTMLSGVLTFVGRVQASAIEGTIDAPTLVSKGLIAVPAMADPPDAVQPGTSVPLDTRDSRFGSNIVLRNGAIWAVQSVQTEAGRAGIRWFQFDGKDNSVLQSGLIEDPSLDYCFPSIAVNALDQVVIGFSGSGESQYASSYAVLGETVGGMTQFGDPVLLQAGGGAWTYANGRFGDFSATVVDPESPDTFWTFQEWVIAPETWAVQITQLHVAVVTQCNDGVDNDGDGLIDMADPGCPFPEATIENPLCDDGIDNDGNGVTDFADSKCQPSWPYWETPPACGLGAELVLVLPLILLAASRRRRANQGDPAPA